MAAAAILDCRIQKISLADSGQLAQTHHFAKFCENWSFHCGDVAIFRIFKMTQWLLTQGWRDCAACDILVNRKHVTCHVFAETTHVVDRSATWVVIPLPPPT